MYALKTYRLKRSGSDDIEITLYHREGFEGRSEFDSWYEIGIEGAGAFGNIKTIKTALWMADKLKKLAENIERRRLAKRVKRT